MIELKNIDDTNKQEKEEKAATTRKILEKNKFIKFYEEPKKDSQCKIDMIKNDYIWKGFPLNERFLYSLFCKCQCVTNLKTKLLPIDDFLYNPAVPNDNIIYDNKILFLKVNKTGNLKIEPNIIHPYVKISFIDLNTGKYLQKSNFKSFAYSSRESLMRICQNKSLNAEEFKESDSDFIYPVSTGFYDLRDKGETFAEWNEPFVINEPAENLFQNSVVIFFELLDFNLNLSINEKEKQIKDFNIPIAWGYLKPVGYSQTYLGKFKIQLYKHKYNKPRNYKEMINQPNQYKYSTRTPEVLFEFNWIKREMYESYLEVELHLENRPTQEDLIYNNSYRLLWKYKLSVFYKEDHDDFDINHYQEDLPKEVAKIHHINEDELKKNKYLLKIIRHHDDSCLLPNKLYMKLKTEKLGCLTLKFSPNGKYLAYSCTGINSNTTIKIFNILDKEHRYHLFGHSEIIHSLEWTENSRVLVSASADFNVKLWSIPLNETSNSENLEYLENDKLFLLTKIEHPSYVYSTAIIPSENKLNESNYYSFHLSTACCDGYVRVFSIELRVNPSSVEHYRTSLVYICNIATEYSDFDSKNRLRHLEVKQKIKQAKLLKNKDELENVLNILNPEKEALLNPTILDKRFPNFICYDGKGKLYAGDSLGSVHVWDVVYSSHDISITKLKSFTHRKLEGDEINAINIDPLDSNRLFIHSRDNSIRLVNPYSKPGKLSIENEYKGVKSQIVNIKSSVSPDGQFIISGSEQGTPRIWYSETAFQVERNEILETKFIDSVTDVSWNKHYNMIAVSGFGQEYPVLVYVYERDDKELDLYNAMKMNKHLQENHDRNEYNEYDYSID